MEMMEALRTAIQEWIVPEFDKIRLENSEIRATLQLTNKRLDDIQAQLIEQSRRIDEMNKRIDETNKRIDETNKRIDAVSANLLHRIEETNKRIDAVHADLLARLDATNQRLDRLYEVIVRRDEHQRLVMEVADLRRRIENLELRLAA